MRAKINIDEASINGATILTQQNGLYMRLTSSLFDMSENFDDFHVKREKIKSTLVPGTFVNNSVSN